MPNGFIVITEKDWEESTSDRKSWMIYNTLQALEERIKHLEGKAFIEKTYAFVGGILGGALAVWAYLGLRTIR